MDEPGIDHVEGAWILRVRGGRLFVPDYALHIHMGSEWKMWALRQALQSMPSPLPTWRWTWAKAHPSYMRNEKEPVAQVEVYAVNVLEVASDARWAPWLEDWVDAVGYFEPSEQALFGVTLSPVERDPNEQAGGEPRGEDHQQPGEPPTEYG